MVAFSTFFAYAIILALGRQIHVGWYIVLYLLEKYLRRTHNYSEETSNLLKNV